jgi:hypothetical protein
MCLGLHFIIPLGIEKGVTPMPFDEPKGVSMTFLFFSNKRINGLTIGSLKVE